MKAILKFDLPEEDEVFKYASHAVDIASALHDFDQDLRSLSKHEGQKTISIEKCRQMLRDKLYDNTDINLL